MDSLDFVSPYLFKHKRRNFLVKDTLRPSDLDALQHIEIRPTDVFLITYPKSGNLLALVFLPKIISYNDFTLQAMVNKISEKLLFSEWQEKH